MKGKFGTVVSLLRGLFGCGGKSVPTISVEQLKDKISSSSSDYVLADVRAPGELTGPLGKIDGVINIPLPELDAREDELQKYKDKEVIFICKSGMRSGIAAEKFMKKDYNVFSLDGGMNEYRKQTGNK